MNLFENLGLNPSVLTTIKNLGFTQPTEIQGESIPLIMQGRDVIGESATGSGKTLAFGMGIVKQVQPHNGLQALILTPTRELAEQVKESLKQLNRQIRVISIYGGVSINPQIQGLTRAEVVVGTPGRLLDHLERNTINISRVKILVVDEADRMFDMGFIDDVKKIIKECPIKRQTLFFSATLSTDIRQFANRFMTDPAEVRTNNRVDPSKLKQVYYDVDKNMKLSLLVHLLKNESSGLVMVFCNTRRNADFVVKNLRANKIDSVGIHGGFSQNKRNQALAMFNNKKIDVLVCTDVAARGLHIDNVSHIYNYDIPRDSKDYIHRIGRTARAGEEGMVVNIISSYDHDNFSRVMRDYRDFKIERIEKPHVNRVMAITSRNNQGNFGNRRQGFKPRINTRNKKQESYRKRRFRKQEFRR